MPKRSVKRSRNCVVSAISGISTSACLPRRMHLGHRLEIDLRLARAGHAVEQRDAVAALGDGARSASAAARCAGMKSGGAKSGSGRARHRLGRQHQRFERALVDQAVDHAGRDAGVLAHRALRPRKPIGERREHALARRGHALRRRSGKPHADPLARRAEMLAHAQRHAQHHAARRQRVVRRPSRRSCRSSGLSGGTSSLCSTSLIRLCRPGLTSTLSAHTTPVASRAPSGTEHEVARREVEIVRHPVRIGVVERDRHQHIDDVLGHGQSAGSRPLKEA